MATPKDSVGIIILGNSGVGKSFLGNVILGREVFKHEYQANAVTMKTEYKESSFRGQAYAIYNIPGLIEAEQERIDLNKREIDISFRQHPNAVVLYVFGTTNGRIRSEDVVAFNALNKAYPFSEKSLVVIINGVNPNRPNEYESRTTTALSSLLKMHFPHICFVNHINQPSEKKQLRQELVEIVTDARPKIHKKVQEINLQAAEMSKLTKQIAEFQKQIEQDREKHRLEVENLKKEFDERERRQKAEQKAREYRLRAEQEAREGQLRAEQEAREHQMRAEMEEKDRQRRAEQEKLKKQIEEKERQRRAEQEELKKQTEEKERQQQVEREKMQQQTQRSYQTKHFACPYFNCNNRCNRGCTGYYGKTTGNRYCTEYHAKFFGTCEKCGRSTDLVQAIFIDAFTGGDHRPDLGMGGYTSCKQCGHIYCYDCCFS